MKGKLRFEDDNLTSETKQIIPNKRKRKQKQTVPQTKKGEGDKIANPANPLSHSDGERKSLKFDEKVPIKTTDTAFVIENTAIITGKLSVEKTIGADGTDVADVAISKTLEQSNSDSKLKFSKDEKSIGKLEKKADTYTKKLDKAREKLPVKKVKKKERVFDEVKGKAKTKLTFEQEVVPISEAKWNVHKKPSIPTKTANVCNKKISIEILEDFHVIYERHKGNYGDLSLHWGAFQEKYKQYITKQTQFLERTYDDPSITNIDECLYDICMTAPQGSKLENTYTLTGGKFAIYHFKGYVKHIYTAYQSIFNVWLSESNCKIDERYGFEIYLLIDCDSMNMEVDLCVPIK